MQRACSWCGQELTRGQWEVASPEAITHGVCSTCVDKIFARMGEDLSSFINNLPAPVVVVDEEGIVLTVNDRAQTLLLKTLPEIEGYRGGEVFECAYARLPEGCGQTVHCSGCTVRRAVMETFQSGESQVKTPAYLHQGIPESYRRTDLLISTEKVSGLVLLRIDRVNDQDTVPQLN